ncbi:MAG TPA: LON peptidase substrate-binding domain-containing protein [Anaeromyxobacter sp.]|nr:LON peptidase substrate-binding domain-containing protein [Anaeromyxobacter sp.]
MAESPVESERMEVLRKACSALKVFPLYGVVVLPGTPTPLHVFEPRYRALVRDALRGDRIVAVPQLLGAEGLRELHPPLRPIAGAGYIEHHVEHEDGRFDIVLRGLSRVRLGEELSSEAAYRTFRAEVAPDRFPPGGPAKLQAEMESLRQLVLELSTRLPPESGAPALAEAVAQLKDPSAAVDLVAAAAVSEPDARQAVLEELDVARRIERVVSEVAAVVLLLTRGKNAQA